MWLRVLLISCVLESGAVFASSTDLWAAYQDAFKNDPTYQQQKAVLQETEQQIPAARSTLLPQLILSGQGSRTYQNSMLLGNSNYDSNQYAINFSQAIFNFSAMNQLYNAKLSVQAAAVLFSAQTQDLMVRFVRAYLNVLQTRDLMRYAESQRDFSKSFLSKTSRMHELQYTTITQYEQAKQQYQVLEGQYTLAKIAYIQSQQNLSNITAVLYRHFPAVKKHFTAIKLAPDKVAPWVQKATQQNLLLRSSQIQLHAAEVKIGTKKLDFLPTVSAITDYSDVQQLSTQAAGGTEDDVRATVVGISAGWNFLQGGQTIADINAAKAQYANADAVVRQRYLEAVTNARNAFIGVHDGLSGVVASYNATQTGISGLYHMEKSYKAGVQTLSDVLQIQNTLYAAQKQYAQSFYSYILNTILLKQAAGTLSPEDLYQLNIYLFGKKHGHITH